MKYRVRITGISGSTFWLDHGVEVANEASAQQFDSVTDARTAGAGHIAAQPGCIGRQMGFEVLPVLEK
jgi:hypothetical protein